MAQIAQISNPNKNTITYIDEVNSNLLYLGIAKIGAATDEAKWQIRKVEKNSTVTSILWADGDRRYDNVWDDRAGLSYS